MRSRMFLVVFRNRKRPDIDSAAYAADAARMEAMARAQPGFVSFKSYESEDGETVAISEWASEAAMHAWGADSEHAAIQQRGRDEYYEKYTLFVSGEPKVRRFERSQP